VATNTLADAQEGDLAKDTRTGIIYQLRDGKWVPWRREGQNIPNFLVDRLAAGFLDLPFMPSWVKEYFAKRAEQQAPPPGTWSYAAGGLAEAVGKLLPMGVPWSLSVKGLTRLPWLKQAVTLPWLKGLPQRAAVGAGAGVISDIVTRGHEMSPEDVAHSALVGGLFGSLLSGSVGRQKAPRVVEKASPGAAAEGAAAGTPEDAANIARSVNEDVELLAKNIPPAEADTAAAPALSHEPTPTQVPTPPPAPTPTPPPFMQTPTQPWPPRLRYGPGYGSLGRTPETFPYFTKGEAAGLAEQISRGVQSPLMKAKRVVFLGGVPYLLNEDDVIDYYATHIANRE
jgi:hypothetical protein